MFDKFLDAMSQDVFEQRPVDLDTFLHDPLYLGKSLRNIELSDIQRLIVEAGSQVYKEETLIELYGKEEGQRRFKTGRNSNLLLMLGKGSGKDFVSQITTAYVVHKLLCLRDPLDYYGKPDDESIDIVNLALNADQAFRVFFTPLKKRLLKSEWFSTRMDGEPLQKQIVFKKNVSLYTLHSNAEGAEGLHILVAILDEIDGFTAEGASDKMYDALSATVVSRFPKYGKVICLSFPRSKKGWMMKQYDSVARVNTTKHYYTYKLDRDLPDGIEDNEFTVKWDEDEVIGYKQPGWFALKAPTFRVNPTIDIEDYRDSFYKDLLDNTQQTLLRVCANPPMSDESIFWKNQEKFAEAFSGMNGWDQKTETFEAIPDPDREYFVHVDLSKKHDMTVVALGHVSHWQQTNILNSTEGEAKPYIVVDLFRVWEPTPENPVNNVEVINFILNINNLFNLQLVTFDRWGSIDLIKQLNENGVMAERNSLDRADYMEWMYAVQDGRIEGPEDRRLTKEAENLIIKNGKVVEPDGPNFFNDISEAVCGVVTNCVANAESEMEIEVVTMQSLKREDLNNRDRAAKMKREEQTPSESLLDFLEGIGGI